MKMFVTGGTGFIGSHVLKLAQLRGHQITAVRRPGSQCRIPFDFCSVSWLERPLDEVEAQDLAGHDVLLHLASVGVSPQRATVSELVRWNVECTARLLESAAAAGIRRVILAGSFAEYGRSADRFENLPVDAPLEPTNAYAASKAASYMLAIALAAQYQLELCYLRIFSAFGDGQNQSNFFPSLKKAALAGEDFPMTTGEQVRDFVPVAEVAQAFLDAASSTTVLAGIPNVRNVASGFPVPLHKFAELWWRRLDARGRLLIGAVPYRASEPMRFAALMDDLHPQSRPQP
ncbi:NAD-dependent epimerase/dehydratase family protein [Roseateles sp.]|uniref:NAD-dependent epimerase/dehydratase family protein n=1 Tax=Roseateles sp. TaxID=1971397 RepID=UPI003266118F